MLFRSVYEKMEDSNNWAFSHFIGTTNIDDEEINWQYLEFDDGTGEAMRNWRALSSSDTASAPSELLKITSTM